MVYQGSKNRLSKHLIPIIQKYIQENDIDTYIELFAGGCNLIDKVDCKNKIAIDVNDELVALLKYAQKDNDLSIAPQDCSWEHYQDVLGSRKLKDGRYTKEYIALIGYMASFGGKYFGGYARDRAGKRNHYRERLNNLKRQAPNLKNITIECMNYKDFDTSKFKNALYYFDPPYRNTTKYKDKINYEEFYDFCRELSKENIVLISEYNMPEDFECIWQKETSVNQDANRINAKKAVEKLFLKRRK